MITVIRKDGTEKTYKSLKEYYSDFKDDTIETGLGKIQILHAIDKIKEIREGRE